MKTQETNQRESIRPASPKRVEAGEYMRMPTRLSFCLAVAIFVATNAARATNISVGLPGITPETPPGDYIGKIYQFALLISGVLALGAIVYGGLRYMTAAGNPSGQSEGKEWIKGAIFGLILLFGAYLILNFINPEITTLSLPALMPIPPLQTTSGLVCGGTTNGTCPGQERCVQDSSGNHSCKLLAASTYGCPTTGGGFACSVKGDCTDISNCRAGCELNPQACGSR